MSGLMQRGGGWTPLSSPPRAEPADGGGGGSGGAAAAADAAKKRIAAAKQYRAASSSSPAEGQPPPPQQQQQQQQAPPSWMRAAGGDDFASSAGSGSGGSGGAPTALPLPFAPGGGGGGEEEEAPRPPPRRADFYTAEGDAAPALPDLLAATPPRLDGGSADRAAGWLAGVLGGSGGGGEGGGEGGGGGGGGSAGSSDEVRFDGSAMRPEAFTAAREALVQRRGAEIITADPSYDPGFVPPPPSDGMMRAGGEGAAAVRELERQQRAQAQARRQQQQQQGAGGVGGGGAGAAPETAEGEAAAAGRGDGAEGAYRPKVSTWGVFERPSDISAAYGGGRTLKPGQALETPEQRAARDAQYKEALAAYRIKAGLEDVSPEQERRARAAVERADALFRAGKLREAAGAYEDARAMIPLRTTLGGRATLGAAVCLDSLGRGEAARDLYRRLRGHPDAATARTAKRLTFGFDAAKFLKADTITYARGNKEYAKYFRAFADANRVYAASEEELERDRRAARTAALIAVSVMAAPVAGVLALVAGR
jgi:tetratricopeptide (TPR) repeat protein